MRKILGPRGRAALLLALVAAVGVLAGITVERILASPVPRDEATAWEDADQRLPRVVRRAGPVGHRPYYLVHLTHELDLSSEQQTRIERILAAQQERFREITLEMEPRFREAAEDARRSILDALDERQRNEFHELRRGRPLRDRPGMRFMIRRDRDGL